MIQTMQLFPGVTLRCFRDDRFKQGCLSLRLVRPMCREEAALNALLPAVLLRGTEKSPDLRSITWRLDQLYGASVGTLVRRVGDYQTTGLYCGFIDDRFALPGDRVFAPMMDLLRELLLEPLREDGVFCRRFVESEKKNLISAMESQKNDKRVYAGSQLLKLMCREDAFGIPRLGEREQAEAITPEGLYAHYRHILETSPVELFYVGTLEPAAVAAAVTPLFENRPLSPRPLPPQTPFRDCGGGEQREELEVAQGKLAMGFVTPITVGHEDFAAMQLLNTIFGGGMTSKLFMNVREKRSLCYDIGSGFHSAKGILTVSAGIDCHREEEVRAQILAQLEDCRRGAITARELRAAKEALLSGLRAAHDSPGAIEGFYAAAALSGLGMDREAYMEAVERAELSDVVRAANSLRLHSVYFLKGVEE